MPPAAKAPSPTHVDGPTYTVKITDSYKKIASAHHITVAQLKAANHIKGDTLHTGDKLIIPASKTMVASATPVSNTVVKPVTSSLIEKHRHPRPLRWLRRPHIPELPLPARDMNTPTRS